MIVDRFIIRNDVVQYPGESSIVIPGSIACSTLTYSRCFVDIDPTAIIAEVGSEIALET